jgi:hypothetical protein
VFFGRVCYFYRFVVEHFGDESCFWDNVSELGPLCFCIGKFGGFGCIWWCGWGIRIISPQNYNHTKTICEQQGTIRLPSNIQPSANTSSFIHFIYFIFYTFYFQYKHPTTINHTRSRMACSTISMFYFL